MKYLIHRTFRGAYDPRDVQRYESISKNGIPQVATYQEPAKLYDDRYSGNVFCLKTNDSRESTVMGSQLGGSKNTKVGFSRSAGI